MPLSGRRVAVTGATGFLGSHIVRRLADDGATVRAVFRSVSKGAHLAASGYEVALAELSDPDALAAAFADCDAVVNTAALSTREPATWEDFFAANAVGSDHLLDACARAGVRHLVYISTTAVYKVRPWTLTDEHAPTFQREGERVGLARVVTNPRYALSKAIGERRARERAQASGIVITVLRPGPIYGSNDHKLTSSYARLMQRAVVPAPTLRLNHVHAGDVAQAASAALATPASHGNAYNVTGPAVSPLEVLRTWKQKIGRGPVLVPVPVPVWVDFDDTAATRDLGFRPRGVAEALDEILERGLPER